MRHARYVQVRVTKEVKLFPCKTPEEFAEWVFSLMERFPAAPLSNLLTHQQLIELKEAFMASAVPEAAALPSRDVGIAIEYVMLWGVGSV
jgi:hypothetical protein